MDNIRSYPKPCVFYELYESGTGCDTQGLSSLKTVIGNLIQLLDLFSHSGFIKKDSVPWSYFRCFRRVNTVSAFHPYNIILSDITITSGATGSAFSLGTYLV
jgi:hypothetical protein